MNSSRNQFDPAAIGAPVVPYRLSLADAMRRAALDLLASRHELAWQRHASHGRGGSSASVEQQQVIRNEVGGDFTNELRAELELLRFREDIPARYFGYMACDDLGRPARLTGWTGQTLGTVISFGRVYESPAFGRCSKRQNITVRAVNGRTYSGTYFKSSGDYCRLKICKA